MENSEILNIAKKGRLASLNIANLSSEKKNEALKKIAKLLKKNTDKVLQANKIDIQLAKENGLTNAMIDRLSLSEASINSIANGVLQVVSLPNPVGEIISEDTRENGLVIKKISVPIGLIAIIYESRPNVSIDCAVLCLKSGNACILRGGKEAFNTNQILATIITEALIAVGIDENAVQFVPTTDRSALNELLKLNDYIHCIIPRGGESLIRFVCENSNIPVIKHYKGVCNLYVEKSASLKMAKEIAINAKCQRPAVCNAIENLVVDEEIAQEFLVDLAKTFAEKNVEMRCDEKSFKILSDANIKVSLAKEEDFYTEYTDYIISIKCVKNYDEAINFINKYSSAHSESIISTNEKVAQEFLARIDSSCVYWNASTRFTDGYEFGLGAEIGISTDRLHARGPMGLKELCTYKYIIFGTGQIRK